MIYKEDLEPIYHWFGLSYANYLVLPRSILQSAPANLQKKIVECLEELDQVFDFSQYNLEYEVKQRDNKGRYKEDPLSDYERGRRVIPHKIKCSCNPHDRIYYGCRCGTVKGEEDE